MTRHFQVGVNLYVGTNYKIYIYIFFESKLQNILNYNFIYQNSKFKLNCILLVFFNLQIKSDLLFNFVQAESKYKIFFFLYM